MERKGEKGRGGMKREERSRERGERESRGTVKRGVMRLVKESRVACWGLRPLLSLQNKVFCGA